MDIADHADFFSYGHLMEMMSTSTTRRTGTAHFLSGEGKRQQGRLYELPWGSQKQARKVECFAPSKCM